MVKVKNKNGRVIKPKGVTLSEVDKANKLVGLNLYDTATRKRPRNPDEERVLKKWEEERGGKKIGTI
ncbi:hypothetical protein [Alkalibacterium olivapovliticus]|uniref:Uncharacterized protein n=1 Tax=Alkalibacterium olivapovliticus TaxID=99907 RepID=A0A2T0W2C0_9LACT|nr:hypothetical protein [Alkalibacterium olivapovliticus]PRY79355.1 hypothetical protein CLV38_12337 [Alkalibacterium olivapovliticus]